MENIPAFKALRRRHVRTWAFKFWEKVDKSGGPDACWPWTGSRHYRGYGRVTVWNRLQFAHRAAWCLEHGVWPAGLEVMHVCDNPPCVNPAHLMVGTHLDNMVDRDTKGRGGGPKRVGERNPNARLTEADIRDIRRLAAAGVPVREIAQKYQADRSNIRDIARRRTWKHVA